MPSPSNGSATGMRAATLASLIFIPKAQGKDKLALLSQVSLGQDVYGGCIHVLKNTDLLKNESVSMFQFKGIVHPKMKVLSSPSCRSKPSFIFGTQSKIFLMKSESFLTLDRQQRNYHVQGSEM